MHYPRQLRADLHCHSTASDGVFSPSDVAAQAAANQVELWSLTDHDTLDGQVEAMQAANQWQMSYVSGVEISALYAGKTIHIVALDFDCSHAALGQLLQRNQQLRTQRSLDMAIKLEALGFRNVLPGATALAGSDANLARPHFARYLVESGQAHSVPEVFEKWLGDGKSCFVPTQWVTMQEAIAAIAMAGGVSVLAHPLAYRFETSYGLESLVGQFQTHGGRAIEVISGRMQDAWAIQELADFAIRYNLHASCGSDFHGITAQECGLGQAKPLPQNLQPVWELFKNALGA